MIDLTRIDWRDQGLGLALGLAAAIVGTLVAELAGVDTADELKAIDWTVVGIAVGRSGVSAVLSVLGIVIPGISGIRSEKPEP